MKYENLYQEELQRYTEIQNSLRTNINFLKQEQQKAQDENTIAVVDGLRKALDELQQIAPPGVHLTQITDGSRQIRVSVENVRRTLIEGALLTVLIVFLFLNSWRSTVITGLTLPIAIFGSFLFMYMLGKCTFADLRVPFNYLQIKASGDLHRAIN
jgi:ABC-type multidrug transport system fused ATPase/permease subunit